MSSGVSPDAFEDFFPRGQFLIWHPFATAWGEVYPVELGPGIRYHYLSAIEDAGGALKTEPGLATIAVAYANQASFARLLTAWAPMLVRRDWSCWVIDGGDLQPWGGEIEQAGFHGLLTPPWDLARWENRLRRFLASVPPVEWGIDLRIEHSYPWARVASQVPNSPQDEP